jgi:HEAT repeat protein
MTQKFIITLLAFVFLASASMVAQNTDFYNQVVKYGTDMDIAAAFSHVTENLGQNINDSVLSLFTEEHTVEVFMSLVRYLTVIEMETAEATLINELYNGYPDEDYRETVIHALGVLGSQAARTELYNYYTNNKSTKRINKAIIDAWGNIGDVGIEDTLIEIIEDKREDDEIKARAILALGQVKSIRSLDLLVGIAQNKYENKYLRMYAVHSLGKIGGESMIDILGSLLQDETHEIAEYAVKAISDIDSKKSGEYLIRALRSDFDKVRYFAVLGLADKNYVDAIEILTFKAEHDRNEKVRLEARKAVESIGNADSL